MNFSQNTLLASIPKDLIKIIDDYVNVRCERIEILYSLKIDKFIEILPNAKIFPRSTKHEPIVFEEICKIFEEISLLFQCYHQYSSRYDFPDEKILYYCLILNIFVSESFENIMNNYYELLCVQKNNIGAIIQYFVKKTVDNQDFKYLRSIMLTFIIMTIRKDDKIFLTANKEFIECAINTIKDEKTVTMALSIIRSESVFDAYIDLIGGYLQLNFDLIKLSNTVLNDRNGTIGINKLIQWIDRDIDKPYWNNDLLEIFADNIKTFLLNNKIISENDRDSLQKRVDFINSRIK